MSATQITPDTPLQRVVSTYGQRMYGKWKPTDEFYNHVGINSKRFGMLLRGQLTMRVNEAQALSAFFNVPLNDLF